MARINDFLYQQGFCITWFPLFFKKKNPAIIRTSIGLCIGSGVMSYDEKHTGYRVRRWESSSSERAMTKL